MVSGDVQQLRQKAQRLNDVRAEWQAFIEAEKAKAKMKNRKEEEDVEEHGEQGEGEVRFTVE